MSEYILHIILLYVNTVASPMPTTKKQLFPSTTIATAKLSVSKIQTNQLQYNTAYQQHHSFHTTIQTLKNLNRTQNIPTSAGRSSSSICILSPSFILEIKVIRCNWRTSFGTTKLTKCRMHKFSRYPHR